MAHNHISSEIIPLKISPLTAGKLIGESAEFVRVGMQQGRLPIGACVFRHRYSYNIQVALLAQYIGITAEECARRAKEVEE